MAGAAHTPDRLGPGTQSPLTADEQYICDGPDRTASPPDDTPGNTLDHRRMRDREPAKRVPSSPPRADPIRSINEHCPKRRRTREAAAGTPLSRAPAFPPGPRSPSCWWCRRIGGKTGRASHATALGIEPLAPTGPLAAIEVADWSLGKCRAPFHYGFLAKLSEHVEIGYEAAYQGRSQSDVFSPLSGSSTMRATRSQRPGPQGQGARSTPQSKCSVTRGASSCCATLCSAGGATSVNS